MKRPGSWSVKVRSRLYRNGTSFKIQFVTYCFCLPIALFMLTSECRSGILELSKGRKKLRWFDFPLGA